MNNQAFDIDAFPWESTEQKKGFMNLFQFLRKHGIDPRYDSIPAPLLAAYMIQKSHEAQEWWTATFGEQVSSLQKEIAELRQSLQNLNKN